MKSVVEEVEKRGFGEINILGGEVSYIHGWYMKKPKLWVDLEAVYLNTTNGSKIMLSFWPSEPFSWVTLSKWWSSFRIDVKECMPREKYCDKFSAMVGGTYKLSSEKFRGLTSSNSWFAWSEDEVEM